MAKRFTDTEKWKRSWFTDLDYKGKLSWIYLLDNCDHTGIWHLNFSLMSFQLGFQVRKESLTDWFGDKISFVDTDKAFIKSFIEFQYGELSPSNNAHKPVLKMLEKLGAREGLASPSGGAQDKDTDKVKDQDKDLDKDKENWKISKIELDEVYALYPRKQGKSDGLRKVASQIKSEGDLASLKKAILIYKEKADPKFIKHFNTFMTSWRDCLDQDWGTNLLNDEASPARSDWMAVAEFVFQVGRKHGFSLNDQVVAKLGEKLANLVRAAGGLQQIGRMPDNEFTKKHLAGILKAASQNQEPKI